MGFLTNVSISNDVWHDIAKDPQRLVDAINIGMNEGILGPVHETLDEQGRGYPEYTEHVRRSIPNGVTVHSAQHYDTAQVIVNPYGSMATAAHEIPHAIYLGWLKGADYRKTHAEKIADELEELARRIRKEIREAKA